MSASQDERPDAVVTRLGVLLYELLAGRPPFTGNSDLDVLQKVVNHEPRSSSAIPREVPKDFERRGDEMPGKGSAAAICLGRRTG